jgi:hypothetical protein
MRSLLGWMLFFGLAYVVFYGGGEFRVPDEIRHFVDAVRGTIAEKFR